MNEKEYAKWLAPRTQNLDDAKRRWGRYCLLTRRRPPSKEETDAFLLEFAKAVEEKTS